jgi:hypothetical protein
MFGGAVCSADRSAVKSGNGVDAHKASRGFSRAVRSVSSLRGSVIRSQPRKLPEFPQNRRDGAVLRTTNIPHPRTSAGVVRVYTSGK